MDLSPVVPKFTLAGSDLSGGSAEYLLSLIYSSRAHLIEFWNLGDTPEDDNKRQLYEAHLRAMLVNFEELVALISPEVFSSDILD